MKNNLIAMVLAGGHGSRMGKGPKPKQFLEIGGKPIIVHTIEKFIARPDFDACLVLTPAEWMEYTGKLIKDWIPSAKGIVVLEGAGTRNETLMNGIRYIEEELGLDDQTVIVTHDSVRPFVTDRIIRDNIRLGRLCDACGTAIPAVDTIMVSEDGRVLSSVPDRSCLYQAQTPQTFKAKKLREMYEGLSAEEKEILTDACKIMVLKGVEVQLVKGDVSNMKITYPHDLELARALLDRE